MHPQEQLKSLQDSLNRAEQAYAALDAESREKEAQSEASIAELMERAAELQDEIDQIQASASAGRGYLVATTDTTTLGFAALTLRLPLALTARLPDSPALDLSHLAGGAAGTAGAGGRAAGRRGVEGRGGGACGGAGGRHCGAAGARKIPGGGPAARQVGDVAAHCVACVVDGAGGPAAAFVMERRGSCFDFMMSVHLKRASDV